MSNRRDFLKASALTAAGLMTHRRLWAQSASAPADKDKYPVAVVGICGQGEWNLNQVSEHARIVAICDVDEKRAAAARAKFPNARFYVDYRRLLDEQHKNIEAVLCATPDHHHAFVSLAAIGLGKHIYCEKPLTRTVQEARTVVEAARKAKVVTQMGTQIHAGDNYRRVVELVQAGTIGAIREVHVWCATVWSGGNRPQDTPPIPEGLNYDLWLGPSPYRPYHPAYLPSSWRGWWDFGGGGHADMACHYMDLAHWALDLRHAVAAETEGPPVHPESAPPRLTVRYEYPARGAMPPVKLTWEIGTKRPTIYSEDKMPDWGSGVFFIGEKGMLLSDYGRHVLLPENKWTGFQPPAQTIAPSKGHHREWIEACKSGGTTTCNFEYSGALAETVLLGNVAYRSGRRIEWDPKTMKIKNAPNAEPFMHSDYRQGWSL